MTRRSLYWERDNWEESKTSTPALDDHCWWPLAHCILLFYHLWINHLFTAYNEKFTLSLCLVSADGFTLWSFSCSSSGDFCPQCKIQEHTGQTCNHTKLRYFLIIACGCDMGFCHSCLIHNKLWHQDLRLCLGHLHAVMGQLSAIMGQTRSVRFCEGAKVWYSWRI